MCGGHSQDKPMDDEVTQMINSLRPQIESHMNRTFNQFEGQSYTTQVVAGTNYRVKIQVGENQFISVTIFKSLPCNGTELKILNAEPL